MSSTPVSASVLLRSFAASEFEGRTFLDGRNDEDEEEEEEVVGPETFNEDRRAQLCEPPIFFLIKFAGNFQKIMEL